MGVKYDIADKDFNRKFATTYQLSILTGVDSLVYLVSDLTNNKALLLRSVAFPETDHPEGKSDFDALDKAIHQDDLFSLRYGKVAVTVGNVTPGVLVPNRLYHPENQRSYLDGVRLPAVGAALQMMAEEVKERKVHFVSELPTGLLSVLQRHFPSAGISHLTAQLLRASVTALPAGKEPYSLLIYLEKGQLHLLLQENGELLATNAYQVHTANDVLYFTLMLLQQYQVDPASVAAWVGGWVLEDAEIFRLLTRYISAIDFLAPPPPLHFDIQFREVQHHLFFGLYAMCVR
ncbi:MAG: hypothetical protein RLY31_3063 [Bacteroidota bacterium]|jgi:hypothetical protein